MVQRCIFGKESKSRNDATRVAETDHPCGTNATLRVPAQIHYVPTYHHWTCTESTHSDEEQGRVLGVEVVVYGHESCKACDCEDDAEADEGEAEA